MHFRLRLRPGPRRWSLQRYPRKAQTSYRWIWGCYLTVGKKHKRAFQRREEGVRDRSKEGETCTLRKKWSRLIQFSLSRLLILKCESWSDKGFGAVYVRSGSTTQVIVKSEKLLRFIIKSVEVGPCIYRKQSYEIFAMSGLYIAHSLLWGVCLSVCYTRGNSGADIIKQSTPDCRSETQSFLTPDTEQIFTQNPFIGADMPHKPYVYKLETKLVM